MMGFRLEQEQFDWVIKNCGMEWEPKTISIMREHFVLGVSRSEIVARAGVSRQWLSNRFTLFEEQFRRLLNERDLQVMPVVHRPEDRNKLVQLDITFNEKEQQDD